MTLAQNSAPYRPAATEMVACPLCGGTRFTPLCETDRYDMDLVTVGCAGCGLVLTNPQPTTAELGHFYEHHYRTFYQRTATPSLEYIRQFRKDERAARTAEFLDGHGALRPGGRVLDIGASEGCILKALRDRVADLHCVAVEPSPAFGEFARRYAQCEVHRDIDAVRRGARFDLVILNHVFEHLKDPVAYLAALAGLLTPTGRVYIDVPDLLEYERLDALHIAHLYHFTRRTLVATAGRAGFKADVVDRHEPILHPKSVRVLLRVADGAGAMPAFEPEGWDRIGRIARRAHRFHRRRWSWGKRLAYRLRQWRRSLGA